MKYIALFLLVITICSCRKYYDCTCLELTASGDVDTFKNAVLARNRAKANDKCADRELELSHTNGLGELFCTLEHGE